MFEDDWDPYDWSDESPYEDGWYNLKELSEKLRKDDSTARCLGIVGTLRYGRPTLTEVISLLLSLAPQDAWLPSVTAVMAGKGWPSAVEKYTFLEFAKGISEDPGYDSINRAGAHYVIAEFSSSPEQKFVALFKSLRHMVEAPALGSRDSFLRHEMVQHLFKSFKPCNAQHWRMVFEAVPSLIKNDLARNIVFQPINYRKHHGRDQIRLSREKDGFIVFAASPRLESRRWWFPAVTPSPTVRSKLQQVEFEYSPKWEKCTRRLGGDTSDDEIAQLLEWIITDALGVSLDEEISIEVNSELF